VTVAVGVALFVNDRTADVRDIARAVEDAGFESFWVPEHTHIPASRDTAYPMGGELPEEYARTFDPFVALTAAACTTTTLRLGTGVCLVAEHDPIVLAKVAATLDVISGGRLLLGVGAGWNREELANHAGGFDFGRRWEVMAERVELMQQLWTQEVASYDGIHARLTPSWQWPKPVQSPLPVLVGGSGPRSMEHAVRYGTGWLPMPSQERTSDRLARLRAMAEAAGRPVPAVTMYAARPDRGVIEHYGELGVERVVLLLPPVPDTVAAVRDLASHIGLPPR
jgi:probable F420-dependent oxidoreductase